jgi:DNA-binding transcriptional LysR family regulator
MPRPLNIRQIEAFKALIEAGTTSRAALLLNVSQPAVSKLISHLEMDTGLKLFDRLKKNRLAPTEHAMRLYDEVQRIFAGVRQVEGVVDTIRREEQGRLSIGVLPALSGSFIQRASMSFLEGHRNVFFSVQSLGSQVILDSLVARKLDIGLVEPGFGNPFLTFEPLMEHSLVCIMPPDHPLAAKSAIEPADLDRIPFVTLNPDSYMGHRIQSVFDAYAIKPQTVLIANLMATICEYVAAGLGVSLIPPLAVSGMENRLVTRRFEPEIPSHFQLCRSAENKNARLVEAFAQELRTMALQVSRLVLSEF